MNITIAYDSTYAASCTQGIWAPNQAAQHWLCLYQTTFYVSFRYVAADTSLQDWGSINNEAADAAVKSHSSRLDVYRHSIRTCATTPTSHCLAATVKTLPGRHSTVHSGEQQNLPSSRQAPNSTITDGQYSNNAKNIFTAREAQRKNRMHTTRSRHTKITPTMGPTTVDTGTYVHNWTRKCGYKMQVPSTSSSGNLGSTYKAKPIHRARPFQTRRNNAVWGTSWRWKLRTTSAHASTLTTSTGHRVGIWPFTRWTGGHPRTSQNER